jgi:AraC family transcriptional regulator
MPVEATARATAFIEANLIEKISIADIAASAGYSLYHFCRTFSSITFHTPYDYLVRRRLTQAACHLIKSSAKIVTIAMDYQFNNQETFSRAFKRMFGLQPNQVRQQGSIDPRRLLPHLTEGHLRYFRAHSALRPEPITPGPLVMAGIMTILGQDAREKQAAWNLFHGLLPETSAGPYYGVTFYPPGWQAQGRLYFAGAPAASTIQEHPFLVRKAVPGQEYLCFPLTGGLLHSRYAQDYVYAGRMLGMGRQSLPDYEIEHYPARVPLDAQAAPGEQIWLPIL